MAALGFTFDATSVAPRTDGDDWDIIAGALALASHGWPVFPCRSGSKAPATANGFKDASTDPEQIKAMFSRPGARLIGIPTGEWSGLIAIDVDLHGESNGTAWYNENIDAMPPTLTHLTLNGGCHLIFRKPDGVTIKNSTARLAKGVDVRGDGGYIIAPPSPGYSIINDLPPGEMPDWLIKACLPPERERTISTPAPSKAPPERADRWAQAALDRECGAVMRAPEGTRNDRLNVAAVKLGSIIGSGSLSRSTVERALTQAAISAGLDPAETAATIRSGIEHGTTTPRGVPERETASPRVNGLDHANSDAGQNKPAARRSRFAPLVYARDMEPRLLAGGTLVKGLLDESAMSVVYAPSNVGKSFLVLDLAFHIATGQPWRGAKIKKPGAVLYLAAEGGYGFVNRVVAIKRHRGYADGTDVPLAVLPCPVDLLDPNADREAVLVLIDEAAEQLGESVVFVVLDTLSRIMAGGDENGPKDMTAVVDNIDYIRSARRVHCCVVHHAGKDVARGARGHSSLRAATDTEIELARIGEGEDKTFTVSVKKQREMAGDDVFTCTLKSVLLGYDEDGAPVTSAVVEHIADDPDATEARPVKETLKALFAKLRELVSTKGCEVKSRRIPADTPVVTIDDWRDACRPLLTGKSSDANRMQFNRARSSLLVGKNIGIWRDHVWPISDPK